MLEVQTRNAQGELRFFPTLKAAFAHAVEDPTVWKVSFELPSDERVRLVRQADRWVYVHIMTEAVKQYGE